MAPAGRGGPAWHTCRHPKDVGCGPPASGYDLCRRRPFRVLGGSDTICASWPTRRGVRMRNTITFMVVVAIFCGAMATIFNIAYLILMLLSYTSWTDGEYHQPVLNVLFIWGALVCIPGLALTTLAWVKGGFDSHRTALGFFAFCAAGSVAGVWLPFIHVSEADVT